MEWRTPCAPVSIAVYLSTVFVHMSKKVVKPQKGCITQWGCLTNEKSSPKAFSLETIIEEAKPGWKPKHQKNIQAAAPSMQSTRFHLFFQNLLRPPGLNCSKPGPWAKEPLEVVKVAQQLSCNSYAPPAASMLWTSASSVGHWQLSLHGSAGLALDNKKHVRIGYIIKGNTSSKELAEFIQSSAKRFLHPNNGIWWD